MKLPIAIMLDTKGPEYRIKTFENGKITLADGDTFTFTTDDIVGNQERVSVNYVHLVENLKVGDTILVNNGLVIFEVIEIKKNDAICKVIAGGELSNRKSMNFPNKVMDNAVNEAKKVLKLKKGDNVVLTGGQVNGQTGNTNLIKVEMI